MKRFLLSLIRFYQKYLNFNTVVTRTFFLTDSACRFNPSCSEYSYQAVEKYGILKGLFFSLKRILKCHPFSKGGDDFLK